MTTTTTTWKDDLEAVRACNEMISKVDRQILRDRCVDIVHGAFSNKFANQGQEVATPSAGSAQQ